MMRTKLTTTLLAAAAAALPASATMPLASAQGPAGGRLDLARAEPGMETMASPTAVANDDLAVRWDERAAEHLLNRAGFGARTAEIQRAVSMGLEGCVEWLLTQDSDAPPFLVQRFSPDYRGMREMSEAEREEKKKEVRRLERRQMEDFVGWWFDRMMSGEEPLRERMTVFWHGFFTSSPAGVRRTFELLNQDAFLRDNALGSYADLLRGITRDPAMLMYLDNHVNRKESPNENFARELMELFSLGEGNYTEHDVKEAARALTGNAGDGKGVFAFRKRAHDTGEKTILGVTGPHKSDDLVDILLAQDACPRWVAGRLIEYLEGQPPSPERLDAYAAFLRAHDFEIAPFLRELFTDPAFYRDEIVGARIASPVDYLVGTARRLGIEPPGALMWQSAAALGQKLLHPPNVKGWEEGMAWITTATLMQRGNFAGLMLGVVDAQDVVSQDDWLDGGDGEMDAMSGGMESEADSMMAEMRGKMPEELRSWSRARGSYRSHLNLGALVEAHGARTDAEIVDLLLSELLAIEAPTETRRLVLQHFRAERKDAGLREGRIFNRRPAAEDLLRRIAHLILSLPEAQLV